MNIDIPYATKVAKLNDEFRKSGFGLTLTQGVQALEDLSGLVWAVQNYNRFTEENDPYHEHDFGTIEWYGEKVFFKIDYYDQKLEYGSDPLSDECRRVITIMTASEY